MNQEWRVIDGFPEYSVSKLGQARRIAATARYSATGKLLKSKPGASGYITISLYRAGEHHSRSLHSLVCEAFHGPRPSPDHQCAHNDGNRTNNRADNLRWADRFENMNDKNLHGTMPRGDSHPHKRNKSGLARGERNGGGGKLTADQVLKIRADSRRNGDVAADFGISKSMVGMIKRGTCWAHVRMPNSLGEHP